MLPGFTRLITVRPTIDTSAYAANDIVGGLVTLAGALPNIGGPVVWDSLTILDEDNEKAALNITLFGDDLTDSTKADQAALTLHANDRAVPFVSLAVTAGDYRTTLTGTAIATFGAIGQRITNRTEANLYLLIQAVATPTYTGADDLILHLGFRGV